MQQTLDISSERPVVAMEDVRRLVEALLNAGKNLSGEELAARLWGRSTESAKRKVRAIAKVARPRVVSFPGSNGYDLWERCTVEQIQHGIEALESQGKDMIKEANVYRMAYHRRFRPGASETNPNQIQFL